MFPPVVGWPRFSRVITTFPTRGCVRTARKPCGWPACQAAGCRCAGLLVAAVSPRRQCLGHPQGRALAPYSRPLERSCYPVGSGCGSHQGWWLEQPLGLLVSRLFGDHLAEGRAPATPSRGWAPVGMPATGFPVGPVPVVGTKVPGTDGDLAHAGRGGSGFGVGWITQWSQLQALCARCLC